MQPLVIAVSGPPGSGKSTYAQTIAYKFNLKYFSAGAIFRQIAKEMSVTFAELHQIAMSNFDIDKRVDETVISEAKKGNIVIDSHLGAWLLKDIADIKIYVTAPLEIRIARISKRDNISIEDAKKIVKHREEINAKRFKMFYNIDINDLSIFDLMINTALWNEEFIASTLISAIKNLNKIRA
ncbi:MAG: AAA family ATPase [Thermoprotei archaeon]